MKGINVESGREPLASPLSDIKKGWKNGWMEIDTWIIEELINNGYTL